MKKFLKIVMILFVVFFFLCLLAGVGIFFALKNFDPNQYKPQLIAQLEQALGRSVQLGDIAMDVSFSQGLSLVVNRIVIDEDIQFSKMPFVSLDKLSLGLDPLSLVTRRQVNISGIEILNPNVSIVRNAQGAFNFQTLALLNAHKASSAVSPSTISGVGFAALLIQNILIKDGVLSFEDHFEDKKVLQVKKIDIGVSRFSLVHPFSVSLKAACLSAQQNIDATANVSVDVLHAAGIIKNLRAQVNLGLVDVKLLTGILPAVAQARLQNPMSGQFECSADELRLSAQGVDIKRLQGNLVSGELKTAYLKLPAKNINAYLEILGQDLIINNAVCSLGQGRIDFDGVIGRYLSDQEYRFTIKADNLNVKEVVDQGGSDVLLEGLVSGQTVITGKGFENLSALNFGSGQAAFSLKDGRLLNMNILKTVLDKMSMLPDLTEKLKQNLPEKYRAQLEQKDTEIKAIDFAMDLTAQQVNIRSAQVQAEAFSFLGQGMMDFGLNMKLATRIIIPQDLSNSMIASVEELKFLADKDGQIAIPINITGKAPNRLNYLPDLEYLGRQLFETRGREEINKLLDKVFDRGQATDAQGTTQDQEGPNPAREMIGNVLDVLFKK